MYPVNKKSNNELLSSSSPIEDFDLRKIFENYLQQQQQQANSSSSSSNNVDPTSSKFEFDFFISQLKQNQSNEKFLLKFFKQLKGLVSLIEPGQFEASFVNLLFFEIKWPLHHSKNQQILNQLSEFLIDLNSAYTCYIYKCLCMLIRMFTLTNINNNPAASIAAAVSVEKEEEIDCEAMHTFAHNIIEHLLKVAPSSKTHLVKIIDSQYPYLTKETSIQEAYIKNVLQLAFKYKDVRLSLMEICVQKMLKIDVKLTREQILESESSSSIQDQEDGDDDEEDQTDQTKEEKQAAKEAAEQSMKHPLADRLDVMMNQFFAFIKSICVDWDSCKSMYKDLLFIFDKYLLCTYGSSHVQFLMFYVCSFRSLLSEGFIDYLWKQFSSPNSCAIRRQICSYYIGSFLARARYVPITTCVASVHLIVQWIHNYIEKFNKSNNNATISSTLHNFEMNRTFYAICQTLFYIVVFRHRQLFSHQFSSSNANPTIDQNNNNNNNNNYNSNIITNDQLNKRISDSVRSWKLNDIISSKLNPLRYVLPSVRKKFARIAYINQIAYCYAIIDANNRVSLPTTNSQGLVAGSSFNRFYSNKTPPQQQQQENPLDSFFPFDPYLLLRSKSMICSIYQEFNDIDVKDDDEEEDDEEDDDEDDDEDEDADDDNDDDDDDDEEMDEDKTETINKKNSNKKSIYYDDDDDDEEMNDSDSTTTTTDHHHKHKQRLF